MYLRATPAAVGTCRWAAARLLVQAGTDRSLRNKFGETALEVAREAGEASIAALLADPAQFEADLQERQLFKQLRGEVHHLGYRPASQLRRPASPGGGPSIWVNTWTKEVEGYWGGDRVTWSFQDNIGLDDYNEEMYNC